MPVGNKGHQDRFFAGESASVAATSLENWQASTTVFYLEKSRRVCSLAGLTSVGSSGKSNCYL